jgi:serine phosphatase RsbU (regulator of sigma subunit)
MGNLAAASRALASAGLGPAELIDRLDRIASHDGAATMTTMACALVDVDAGTMRYATAGHPPPMLRTADGRTTRLEDAAAPPLGVGHRGPRTEAVIGLARGSALLFYTDGLVEQRRQPLDPRLDALESALGAASCADVDALCDTVVRTMVGDGNHDDDVALVCVALDPILE